MPMPNYPNPNDGALPPALDSYCCSSTMPLTTSSPRDEDHEKSRRRRKEYDRDSSEKLHRSSKHKTGSSSTLGGRKISSGSSRRRSSSRDRDRTRDKAKDRDRDSIRSSADSERGPRKSALDMERRSGGQDDRAKTSYPSFSKAHSREAVGSREEIVNPKLFTPEPTEFEAEKEKRRNSTPANVNARAPPSPPLTAADPDVLRSGSRGEMRNVADRTRAAPRSGRRSMEDTSRASSIKAAKSGSSLRREAQFGQSEISSMPGAFPDEAENKSTPTSSYRRTASTNSQPPSTLTQHTMDSMDSDATSIAADRRYKQSAPIVVPVNGSSPPSATDSQPRTPTPSEPQFPASAKATPIFDVGGGWESMESGRTPTAGILGGVAPPPPPPPPPMAAPLNVPRVDYLLKNGGLPYMIPKKLVQTTTSASVQQYAMYQSPPIPQGFSMEEYQKVFNGLYRRLDDYLQVLRCNGSIAVATGYRSVARRLLDKLSQIFARDISSQRCDCVVCNTIPQPYLSDEEDSGVSWGEILEHVSGRRELPQWPPFIIQPDDGGLGIQGVTEAPMQKIDIDVPEEYRDHYKRQNQKTKIAVQRWLEFQPSVPSSPPEEADEDTLMFAMMTKLNVKERNLFIALMHGQTTVSEIRAPTPAERPSTSSTALKRARLALQRLYRLERTPRDCECAMYLLNNPPLHGMLATLAEVNEQEWDILISGRFDGFLWSGAEMGHSTFASPSISRMPSRNQNITPFSRNTTPFSGISGMQSRGPTPFGSSPLRNVMSPDAIAPSSTPMFPSRGPTPALPGASMGAPPPVQMDEETEVAVLAELERNIYTDMERLEDAFELLHGRAELVRQLLRERSAGLSMQAQLRRGSLDADPGVRLGTPASGFTDFENDEDDDGLGDVASLAPDDSASQISFNRRVRKRRERHTPAPVAEEDEYEGPITEKDRLRERERRKDGRRSVPRR